MATKFLVDLNRDRLMPRWSPRHSWYLSPENGITGSSKPVPIYDSSGANVVGEAVTSKMGDHLLVGEVTDKDWATLLADGVIQRAHISVTPAVNAISVLSKQDVRQLWEMKGVTPDAESEVDLRRCRDGLELIVGTVEALHLDALGVGASLLGYVGNPNPEARHKFIKTKIYRKMAREALEIVNDPDFIMLGMTEGDGPEMPETGSIMFKGRRVEILYK